MREWVRGMNKMSKKKKTVIIGSIVILVLLCIAVWLFLKLSGTLALCKRLQGLMENEFRYNIACRVEGMEEKLLPETLEVNLIGDKSDTGYFGELYYDEQVYAEIYGNYQDELLFNIAPVAHAVLDQMDEKADIKIPLLNLILPKEMNVSIRQIEEITGKKLVSLPEVGITSEFFRNLTKGKQGKAKFKIEKYKDILPDRKFVGEEAAYFKITLLESGAVLVIGTPDSPDVKKMSMELQYEEVTLQLVLEYEFAEVDDREMPEESLSESVVGMLKRLYEYYSHLT